MNIKSFATFAVGPILSAFIGLFTIPFLTWYFSIEAIGQISLVQSFLALFVLIATLGLDSSYIRFYHESKNKYQLFKNCIVLPVIFSVFGFFLILTMFRVNIANFFKLDFITINIILLACIVSLFIRFISSVLRMEGKGIAYSISSVMPKFLYPLAIFILISLGFENNFYLLISCFTFSLLLVMCLFIFNTRSYLIKAYKTKLNKSEIYRVISYGLPLILGNLAYWGLTGSDKFILQSLSTLEQLGLYSVAVSFSGAALILQSIFSLVWAPNIYKIVLNKNENGVIKRTTNIIIYISLLLFSLCGLFAPLITYLLPNEYSEISSIFIICMLFPLYYTISECTVIGINITKKVIYSTLISIFCFIVNLTLNYYFIPKYGAIGAAISSGLAFILFLYLRTIVSNVIWEKHSGINVYVISAFMLFLSIFYAFWGRENIVFFSVLWLVIIFYSSYKLELKKLFIKYLSVPGF
jgi:O-antigen/teichoic acid export membrane protein